MQLPLDVQGSFNKFQHRWSNVFEIPLYAIRPSAVFISIQDHQDREEHPFVGDSRR
jgi:hypothetical protein